MKFSCSRDMDQLNEDDHRVVETWWQSSKSFIFQKGFTLDNYHRPVNFLDRPKEHTPKGFRDILTIVGAISVGARSNKHFGKPLNRPFELTVGQTAPNNVPGGTRFQVDELGSRIVVATPILPPTTLPPQGWRQRFFGYLQN